MLRMVGIRGDGARDLEKVKVQEKGKAKDLADNSEDMGRAYLEASQEYIDSRAHGERWAVATADWKDHKHGLYLFKTYRTIRQQQDGMTVGIGAMKDMPADTRINCLC